MCIVINLDDFVLILLLFLQGFPGATGLGGARGRQGDKVCGFLYYHVLYFLSLGTFSDLSKKKNYWLFRN